MKLLWYVVPYSGIIGSYTQYSDGLTDLPIDIWRRWHGQGLIVGIKTESEALVLLQGDSICAS
jgi:hypothetical protein